MNSETSSSKVALVVGASGGLGSEIARSLSSQGFHVGLHYHHNKERAVAAASSVSGPTTLVHADITDEEDVQAMVDRMRSIGPVSVLINAAGARNDGLLATQPRTQWKSVVELNLYGCYLACRAVLPSMMLRRWGRIVNVISPAALMGSPGQTAYSAAKAGILGLTRSLACECGKRGVTVNALSPGYMDTGITADVPSSVRESILSRVPLGRPGETAEVAMAVRLFIECGYITGQTISVDGGLTS